MSVAVSPWHVAVVTKGAALIVIALRRTPIRFRLLPLLELLDCRIIHNLTALGMLHRNVPVVEGLCLVSVLDRLVGLLASLEQDVGEAARDLCVMVLNDMNVQYGSKLGEVLPQLILCGAAWYARNVDVAVVLRLDAIPLMVMDDPLAFLVMIVSLDSCAAIIIAIMVLLHFVFRSTVGHKRVFWLLLIGSAFGLLSDT